MGHKLPFLKPLKTILNKNISYLNDNFQSDNIGTV